METPISPMYPNFAQLKKTLTKRVPVLLKMSNCSICFGLLPLYKKIKRFIISIIFLIIICHYYCSYRVLCVFFVHVISGSYHILLYIYIYLICKYVICMYHNIYPLVNWHSYGKSPFLLCRLTMNMTIFNSNMLNYQRVNHPPNHHFYRLYKPFPKWMV